MERYAEPFLREKGSGVERLEVKFSDFYTNAAADGDSRLQSYLIADLLDYAGMRFGKMHLEMQPIDSAVAV